MKLTLTGALVVGAIGGLTAWAGDIPQDWDNPHNGRNEEGDSGRIVLGVGGVDREGYDGSSLRYYLNDIEEREKRECAALEESVATSVTNVAAATAAEAIAIATVVEVGAIAVASVELANAVLEQAIADQKLSLFKNFTERNVGAIDYSGSLTVEGYGNLEGQYQNVETMTLTPAGNSGMVTLSGGLIDTVQSLVAEQELTIGADAEVRNVESMTLRQNLTNNGTMRRVENIVGSVTLSNSGTIAYLGSADVGSFDNKADGSVLDADLIQTGDFWNAGKILVDDLEFDDGVNSGDLTVLCNMSGRSFTLEEGGSLGARGTVSMEGNITTAEGSTFLAAGAVTANSFVSNGTTQLLGPVTASGAIDAAGGKWQSLGTITTTDLNVGNDFTSVGDVFASGSVTVDSDKNVYFGGTLSAGKLTNSADRLATTGAVDVLGTITNDGTWDAKGASMTTGTLENTGTLKLAGSLVVADSIWQTESGNIVGTTPTASVKANALTGGALEGIYALDVLGEVSDADVTLAGAGSSARLGSVAGSTSVSDVGTLVVYGTTETTGAISGAGIGSALTFMDTATMKEATNFDALLAAADLNADGITGAGADASVAVGGSLAVAGTIAGVDKLVVVGDVVAENLDGTGRGSVYKVGGTLDADKVTGAETLVTNAAMVDVGASILGTGAGSLFRTTTLAGEDGSMAGTVAGFERLEVEEAVTNDGTISGTESGSVGIFGDSLTNNGTIEQFKHIEAQDVANAASGTITATGAGSDIVAATMTNAGTIAGAETITASDSLANEAGGVMTGTGDKAAITVGGSFVNAGTVERYGAVEAASVRNDADGTLTLAGDASTVKAGELTNSGVVANVGAAAVDGAFVNGENASFTGAGEGSALQAGTLVNLGEIANVGTTNVAGDLTNETSGTITGVGANAALTVGGDVANAGNIDAYATVEAQKLANREGGAITTTGAGSVVKAQSVENAGSVANVGTLAVDGTLENAETGAITAAGDGSSITAATITNAGNIENAATTTASGEITNAAGAAITATGVGSTLTADAVTNEGTIADVETFAAAGALTNAASGTIAGSGAGSAYAAGSVENAGALENIQSLSVAGTIANAAGGTITATGAGSVYSADEATNEGAIAGLETFEVAGTLTNAGSGTITATGAGSIIAADALENAGAIDALAILDVTGSAANSGTIAGAGAGSVFSFAALENTGTIDGVETLGTTGNLSAAAGGAITGSGADAAATVLGDMDNAGDYGGFTTTRVEGNLTNSGSFEVGNKTTVIGDFANDGGTLSTDLYGGALGTVVTHGEATISGGTLELNTIGEQLQIGEYYYVVSTDGGLTVDGELAIEENGTSPKLFHAEGFYDDYNYYVGLRRDQEYGDDPSSANEASLGQYVDDAAYLLGNDSFYEDSDLVAVLSKLDETKAADPTKATAMLLSMDGEIYADMGYVGLENTTRAHERLADMIRPNTYLVCEGCGKVRRSHDVCEHCGDEHEPVVSVYAYPEEAAFGRRFWATTFGAFNDVKGDGNARGFDANTFGLAVGSDAYRDARTRLGVFGSFQSSKIKGDGSYMVERGEVQSYAIGGYGYRDNALGTFVGSAAVGIDSYKATRTLNWGDDSLARTHKGTAHGTEYSLRLEEYRNVQVGSSILQPYVAGSFVYSDVNGTRERTIDGARDDDTYLTQLHTDGYDLTSYRSALGARWTTTWNTKSDAPLTLRANLSWLHEFGDTYATTISSFTATRDGYQQTSYQPSNPNGLGDLRYSVSGVGMGRDYAWLGLGFTTDGLFDCVSLFGGYDCLLNKRTTSHNINLGVDVEW